MNNSISRTLKSIILLASMLTSIPLMSQNEGQTFKGYYHNNIYNVYIRASLYKSDMIIPSHELFGELPGYLAKERNNFYWLITSAKVINDSKAELHFINDYGSEDFTADFIKENDSTFVLKHKDGSPLKVPNKGKWQKLPKEIIFKKKL